MYLIYEYLTLYILKFTRITHKDSVPTSEKTQIVSIKKLKELIYENQKYTYMVQAMWLLCGQNEEFWNV
jgi:hypothetical protein